AGPGVDPAPGEDFYRCGDLAHQRRWPVLGARLHQRLGLASLLSFRLHLIGEPETVAALHLYSDTGDAFGDDALAAGGLLAAHGALAVSAQLHRQRAQHLEQALASSREMSTAVGVLMARYRLTRSQAMELVRDAAQESARPMAEIAAEIVDTEVLRVPPMPTATPAHPRTTPKATP
ncbi:ANTAR domain-containing protein, partial [Kocuria arenosa]|uniref:ANTAR domain-containing protein n=1 Tax=Kocuria arenosa TaxID=3071446 RepID=UPI0034D6EE6E